MKNFFKYICVSLLVLPMAGLTGCDGDLWKLKDDSKGSYKPTEGEPIATTLDESGNFQEWVHVLQYSESYTVLNSLYDGQSYSHTFTHFAPTDEALQSFYVQHGVSAIEDLGVVYAQALVKCLTYDGDSLKLSEVFDEKTTYKNYTSENSDALYVTIDTIGDGFLINDSIQVSRDYIRCSNGFVYTVQGLITPLIETISDRLAQDGQSSIMMAALDEAGYLADLGVVADTVVTLGVRSVTRRNYTLLNVHDDAFQRAGINSVADLKSALLARAQDASVGGDSLLRLYVQYHLFNTRYTTSSFATTAGEGSSANMTTMAPNQILTVSSHMCGEYDQLNTTTGVMEHETAYYVTFNDEDSSYVKPSFSIVSSTGLWPDYEDEGQTVFLSASSNIKARNGYLHTVSSWLPIYEPEQTTVVWDLADNAEIRNAVGASYQPTVLASNKEEKFDLSRLSCFEVKEGPQGKAGATYANVSYVTCKSNLKDCLNYDRLAFDLGYQGYVVMNTPTLVKGKYKVEISIAYLGDQSFMRICNNCKGGQMKVTVDGENQILTAPYTTIVDPNNSTPSAGVYSAVLYDEIEFATTTSHAIKMVVMDPAASTNSKFALQFDAITFTPIK